MWSYKRIEHALARLYGANAVAQVGPFRGRIKHLQRLGVPMNRRPGRGSKAAYDVDEVLQFLFCLELTCFGVDPYLAVILLEKLWDRPGPGGTSLSGYMRQRFEADEGDASRTHIAFMPMIVARGWDPDGLGGLDPYEIIDEQDVVGRVLTAVRASTPRMMLLDVRHSTTELRVGLAA